MATSIGDYALLSVKGHDAGSMADAPLSTFTQLIGAASDNGVATTTIGFTFMFEGEPYTSVQVCANGLLQLIGGNTTLVGGNVSTTDNTQLTSTAWADPVIAPWWADLATATSGFRGGVYKLTRPTGLGQLETIFRFVCFGASTDDANNYRLINFEVSLNSAGAISLHYAPIVSAGSPGASGAVIGISGRARTAARARLLRGNPNANAAASITKDWPATTNGAIYWVLTPPRTGAGRVVAISADVQGGRVTR